MCIGKRDRHTGRAVCVSAHAIAVMYFDEPPERVPAANIQAARAVDREFGHMGKIDFPGFL